MADRDPIRELFTRSAKEKLGFGDELADESYEYVMGKLGSLFGRRRPRSSTRVPAKPEQRPWWVVLGVDPLCSKKDAKAAYKRLLLRVHPDHGGSDAAVREVKAAWEQAKGVL